MKTDRRVITLHIEIVDMESFSSAGTLVNRKQIVFDIEDFDKVDLNIKAEELIAEAEELRPFIIPKSKD